jgi:DNA processing protein
VKVEGGDLVPYIALSSVKGVGPAIFKRLVEKFVNPARAFAAKDEELAEIEGVNARAASEISKFNGWKAAEKLVADCAKLDVGIVPLNDERYPPLLREIQNPAPMLFVRGELGTAGMTGIAVVGSRYPSEGGQKTAYDLAHGLGSIGCTVISGFARGIDSTAHRGALTAGARTLAVLGCGVDRIYPPENVKLYRDVIASGAMLSEYPPGTPPDAVNFPHRNRIISGMSHGIIVVEASMNSGSLITAKWALDQGREVFAVPGSISSYKSKGTNKLIKDGARLVEDFRDVVEELATKLGGEVLGRLKDFSAGTHGAEAGKIAGLSGDEAKVAELLADGSLHMDDLLNKTGTDMGRISAALVNLELKGLVEQVEGGKYARKRGS